MQCVSVVFPDHTHLFDTLLKHFKGTLRKLYRTLLYTDGQNASYSRVFKIISHFLNISSYAFIFESFCYRLSMFNKEMRKNTVS